MVTCTYAGLALATDPDPSTPYIVESIQGWHDGAPDATTEIEHWSGDGTVSLWERLGARTVEVSGVIDASGPDADAALAALRRPRRGILAIDGLECDVRRVDMNTTRLGATWGFTLYLRADDPLRYGPTPLGLTSGLAAVLANPGDATSWPRLSIAGPVAALTITHPGGTWSLAADIPAEQAAEVFMRDGEVWRAGARWHVETTGREVVVPPGGASVTATWTGAGAVTVSHFEAWA